MYNGIGLQTPRGSGTNGYVQRNMSFVSKSREKVNYKTEDDIKKLDAMMNKKPNQGILAHERKRLIELKCLEMHELMEEQGYPDDEIESKVSLFRQMLLQKDGIGEKETPKDESGRPVVKESHQIAEANQEKNLKMREALGISQYFVEGSSLDPERKAKEAAAAAAAAAEEEAKKKYTIIPDSSSSSSPERTHIKEKEKKRKKKKSRSSHEKIESASSSKKKKSSKKHKKERSLSPEVRKKKKQKKPNKDKPKHKSKFEDSSKKRNRSSSSSSAVSSSSDDDDDETNSRSSSRNSNSDSNRKQKVVSKHEKNHKGQHRKRSSSSESIRYSKDSRSRKDIYEAKKGKRKRKSAHSSSTSSSEDDSSPKYYRLEPVLVKSKLKHKKNRQFIEIPKNSAFDFKKYDKKKRVRDSSSSSSSDEKSSKKENKRRKHSVSPVSSKAAKHSSRMDTEKPAQKRCSSSKASKKYIRDSQSSSSDEQQRRRKRSKSGSSQHKVPHLRNKAILVEDVHMSKKKKEKVFKNVDEKFVDKDSRDKKKHRKESKSPKRHNGYRKHAAKSTSPETDATEESERYQSLAKHKRHAPKSPSHSPAVYKHKKHVISDSPPYVRHVPQKDKCIIKSPSYSPPKKTSSKTVKPQESVSRSPSPNKHSQKHDVHNKNYAYHSAEKRNHSKDYYKNKSSSTKKHNEFLKHSASPLKNKSRSKSNSASPSPPRNPKSSRQKVSKSHNRNSHSEKDQSKNIRDKDQDPSYIKSWKSKAEVKDTSVVHKRGGSSPDSILEKENSEVVCHSTHKLDSSKHTKSANYESNKSVSGLYKKNSSLHSSSLETSTPECHMKNHGDSIRNNGDKRKKSCSPQVQRESIRSLTNDGSSVCSDQRNSSPRSNTGNYSDGKSDILFSKGNNFAEKKDKPCNFNESSLSADKDVNNDELGNNKSSKRGVMTVEINSQDSRWTEILNPKEHLKSKNGISPVKDIKNTAKQNKIENDEKTKEKNTSPEYSASQRNANETIHHGKNIKSQEICKKTPELSRSRSRSVSVARSCSRSASERSSRSHSRSYSKSYSKSRSKSYSKSRSRSKSPTKSSKSRSRSCSKSCSKSYSRSRSISIYSRSCSRSYSSRSRSRSRSIARSPSIPRRRGSPSFLDKRRITS